MAGQWLAAVRQHRSPCGGLRECRGVREFGGSGVPGAGPERAGDGQAGEPNPELWDGGQRPFGRDGVRAGVGGTPSPGVKVFGCWRTQLVQHFLDRPGGALVCTQAPVLESPRPDAGEGRLLAVSILAAEEL